MSVWERVAIVVMAVMIGQLTMICPSWVGMAVALVGTAGCCYWQHSAWHRGLRREGKAVYERLWNKMFKEVMALPTDKDGVVHFDVV